MIFITNRRPFEPLAQSTAQVHHNCCNRNNALTWERGRLLKKYGNIAEYEYDLNGIRTSKKVGDITTKYFLDGTRIIAQNDYLAAGVIGSTYAVYYKYGTNGIEGMYVNGQDYHFKKNLQGDIIAIYDNDLDEIVKYTYDAWGNHIVKYLDNSGNFVATETDFCYNDISNINRFIANKNPFRYRSYYYDFETGLYYLNSRYYDPEIGRFINIDDISIINESKELLNGLNLFIYCNDNPIMHTDTNGQSWLSDLFGWILNGILAVAAVVAIVVVAAGVVASGGLLGGILLGAGIGVLTSMGASIYAQGGFVNANPWQVLKAGVIGGVIGAVTGATSWFIGGLGQTFGQAFGFALSHTTHIASGIQFGKVFSTAFLMKTGGIVGNVLGGLIGGTISNYFANHLFGNKLDFKDTMNQGISGEIPSWIIGIFRWLIS